MPILVAQADDESVRKVLIVAQYAEFEIETHTGEKGKDKHNAPVLQTDEGNIFGTNAIARHIARSSYGNLYGSSPFENAAVDQWVDYATTEIDLPASAWLFPIKGLIPNHPAATSKAKADLRQALKFLDDHLVTNTFLVGERVSLADIAVGTSLVELYRLVLDPGFCKQFTNTNRWFNTLTHQQIFVNVLGEVELCKKMAVAPAAPEGEEKAAEKPKKAEQPKKEKQEQPKKETPKKEKEAEEEEEESYEDKPKGKNPLDSLPPSKLIMDEWKRVYSNEDTRTVAIPWFWEHYDPEGYSLWWCDYKYNHECEKVFMTCNLIGGFFQRLETLHKYAFGSMVIFGEEPTLEVQGFWLVRGKEVPADMLACDDYIHYNWRPVDISDPASKTLIEDYLAWDGHLGGKRFNQGKIYK